MNLNHPKAVQSKKPKTMRLFHKCRVCSEYASKMYLLDDTAPNFEINISTMLTYCTSVEIVLSEELPKYVCVSCFTLIRITYNFIKRFKESELKLLGKIKIKTETGYGNFARSQYGRIEAKPIFIKCEVDTVSETFQNEKTDEQDIKDPLTTEECIQDNKSFVNPEKELDTSILSKNKSNRNKKIIVRKHVLKTKKKPKSLKVDTTLKQKSVKESDFICPLCPENFGNFGMAIEKHLHTAHKDEKISCDCSQEVLFSVSEYIIHYKDKHRYICQVCNKSFSRSNNLKSHVALHSDKANYVCNKCGSTFKTYDTFRYHIKTHDGKRDYLCTECGRTFLQAVHLKYHMWSHSDVKQFPCNTCDKSYTSVTHLKKHKRKTLCGAEVQ